MIKKVISKEVGKEINPGAHFQSPMHLAVSCTWSLYFKQRLYDLLVTGVGTCFLWAGWVSWASELKSLLLFPSLCQVCCAVLVETQYLPCTAASTDTKVVRSIRASPWEEGRVIPAGCQQRTTVRSSQQLWSVAGC